jgi:hypothetical protein
MFFLMSVILHVSFIVNLSPRDKTKFNYLFNYLFECFLILLMELLYVPCIYITIIFNSWQNNYLVLYIYLDYAVLLFIFDFSLNSS